MKHYLKEAVDAVYITPEKIVEFVKKETMQREIKFRAWDKEEKKMRDLGVHIFFTPNGELVFRDKKLHYIDDYPLYENERMNERFELMQYTGLKDCNGKEIFDGDIVRWGMINERSYECWHRYAVVEINPDIQFRILYYIIGKTGERKEPDGHIFHYGEFAYKETHKHLEIIGNIYENT